MRIVCGDWDSLCADAKKMRLEVFVIEQGVPVELEWDDADPVSVHAVAYDDDDLPVATGRLLPDGRIGRMAVSKSLRGSGLGSAVLQALLEEARRRGHGALLLHAQVHAEAFYGRHGFVREGETFMEAGTPHVTMRLTLSA